MKILICASVCHYLDVVSVKKSFFILAMNLPAILMDSFKYDIVVVVKVNVCLLTGHKGSLSLRG
jgi:hypothetical protein